MKNTALLCAAVLAVAVSADAARRPRRGKAPAAKPPAAEPAPLKPSLAPPEEAAEPQEPAPRSEAPLGVSLRPVAGGLAVESAPSGGPLAGLDLRPGDLMTHFAGKPAPTLASLKAALAGWPAGERLWAVVLRGGLPVGLQAKFEAPAPLPSRTAFELTPKEEAARESHLEAARAAAKAPLAALETETLTLAAGEKLWVRFPQGLPRLSPGETVVAETAAPLAADKKLDFLAVPPGSKVWLSALSVREDGPASVVRLHAYKLQPAGGRVYPLSAVVASAAGSGDFARVTPGGALVTTPDELAKTLLGPGWSLQLRLLDALTLHEPPAYYRAGPGLWFKEALEDGVRVFEVTLAQAGRSAERAGLKPGDRVYSVGGDSAARLGFAEGLGRLYGPAGSEVAVRVTRKGAARSETLSLRRGAVWRQGYGLRLRREGPAVLAQAPAEGSPAEKAGVREGMRLLRVGDADAATLDRAALRALLEGSGDETVEFVFLDASEKERAMRMTRGWYAAAAKPDLKRAPYSAD